MSTSIEYSVVTESYNLTEGAVVGSLRRSLESASAAAGWTRSGFSENESGSGLDEGPGGRGEVLLADVDGRPEIDAIMLEFPHVRRIDCRGLSYDAAKNRAIEAARGEYVAFLDGDCVPDAGWIDHLLEPLRSERAYATCGYTSYAGGFWASVQSIMDFGFLLPLRPRPVGCYVCNNWAARRTDLLADPIPEDDVLRCSCYPHAQVMERRGTPFELAPRATAHHDLPPFWAERWRRGYDVVAACWGESPPAESRLLRYGLLATPLFYIDNVRLDWKRLRANRRDIGLSRLQMLVAFGLMPILRFIDIAGIVRALLETPARTAKKLKPVAPSR